MNIFILNDQGNMMITFYVFIEWSFDKIMSDQNECILHI